MAERKKNTGSQMGHTKKNIKKLSIFEKLFPNFLALLIFNKDLFGGSNCNNESYFANCNLELQDMFLTPHPNHHE